MNTGDAIKMGETTKRGNLWRRLTPYAFMSIGLVWYLIFLVYPMFQSFIISLTTWDGIQPISLELIQETFVGFRNYREIFISDEVSRGAILNNLAWTAATLLITTTLALLLANVLNNPQLPGRNVFRAIFYSPAIMPMVAVGLIWSWMYHPQIGIINQLLKTVGLGHLAVGWLARFETALPAVFVTAVWSGIGFPFVLYLAGMQGIPVELYESAKIDGANSFQLFRHITIPCLKETHVIVLCIAVINSFKVFDLVFAMTYGGPGRATQTLGTWMYFTSFQYYKAGYGSALAWIIALITMAFAIPYVRAMSKD